MQEVVPAAEAVGTNWVGVGALVLGAMGFLSTWLWRAQVSVSERFKTERDETSERLEEVKVALNSGNERFRKVDAELADFKLKAATDYALRNDVRNDLREMEERITKGFNEIKVAIDALTKAFNDHRAEEARR